MKARIYCDGACSKNPGPGGWAGIIFLPTEIIELSGNELETTNNRMELRAALESIRRAIISGFTNIEIYSDSAYVVNGVDLGWLKTWKTNGWKTTRRDDIKNKDLWEIMLKLTTKYKDIKFIKIKGHNGDKNNERVDKLAKMEVEKIK
jgi:ribonuclease HI